MSLPPLGVIACCFRLCWLAAVGCGGLAVALRRLVSAARLPLTLVTSRRWSGPASLRVAELVRVVGGSWLTSSVVLIKESLVEAFVVASGVATSSFVALSRTSVCFSWLAVRA